MSHQHDEHGRPDAGYEHEHGPEWWAKSDVCRCGHRLTMHRERVGSTDAAAGTTFPCGYSEGGIGWANHCACLDFDPAS